MSCCKTILIKSYIDLIRNNAVQDTIKQETGPLYGHITRASNLSTVPYNGNLSSFFTRKHLAFTDC